MCLMYNPTNFDLGVSWTVVTTGVGLLAIVNEAFEQPILTILKKFQLHFEMEIRKTSDAGSQPIHTISFQP